MKAAIIIFFITIFCSVIIFPQVNWYSQNSGTNRELTDICFVDQNNGWVSGWTETMLHTTDGGQNWIPQTVPPNNAYYSVYFTDLQNGWASGYSGKIIHTSDGGQNWVSQSSPTNYDLYNLFFINSTTGWAAGGDYGSFPSYINDRIILKTTNGGNTWATQYGEAYKQPLKSIFFLDENNGYATGPDGVIMHTTNGGTNWGEQQVIPSFSFSDIFFTSNNIGFVVGEYLGVPHYSVIFETTDGGNNWSEIQLGYNEVLAGIYFPDSQNGWAVGNDYGNGNIGIVYHSSDGGTNWSYQNIPSIDALACVYFINDTKGWAAGHLGTIVATENPTPVELTSFAAMTDNSNVTLNWQTATETNNSGFEIQRSDIRDQNSDWEKIGFVEGNGTSTKANNYSFTDKNLEAGSYSYRLVQIDFDGTRTQSKEVSVEINSFLNQYSLSQNYPNPFNPTTTIEYSLLSEGNVTLKIFNTIGEEIKTLVDGYKAAGNYKINFNASKLTSGIYYYRIESGSFSLVKKMILLK